MSTHHPAPDALFWKRKLAAFLHDSPSKALDIRGHEDRALKAFIRAGLIADENDTAAYDKLADRTAAAADRIPFPSRRITCSYNGVANRFRHPLEGSNQISPQSKPLSVTEAEATEGVLQPQLELPSDWDEGRKWRAQFFAHWRLWRKNCTEKDPSLGFLPADTRLPDHSIWQHMGVVSALAATTGQPAFLKFQLGPVQEFIAAARSTRDLWSGSFLISWLMTTGMAALAREIGPDAVIFPNLHGQPLFDLHFRAELWQPAKTSHQDTAKSAWESLGHRQHELLTPNLPNVFLAIVPANRAEDLARLVEQSIRTEWAKIADHVWDFAADIICAPHAPSNARGRFDAQVARHLDIAWQTTPWPSSPEAALKLAEALLPKTEDGQPNPTCERLRDFIRYFTEVMPVEHRDDRYYADSGKTKLNNVGAAWSALVALNAWQLDASRQTRAFKACSAGGWETGSTHNGKDALTGREEMIVGGKQWQDSLQGKWRKLFRHTDEVGALTLIKRTWHLAYLKHKTGWNLDASPERGFRMPDVQRIAANQDTEDEKTPDDTPEGQALYYAVLALDGDSIGKIVSGEKTPELGKQLADYGQAPERAGARIYFENQGGADLLKLPRPLSPGFHLQFSEALSNFALHCVHPIVEAHKGKLLYAGGDDVLAILPAAEVIACADALQRAFRGDSPQNADYKLEQIAPGFLARTDRFDSAGNGLRIPFIVPGPACTASVGIAIAKVKEPLQDVVRAAQAAEKRAKKIEGKHALAVTVMKGSEITEWAGHFGTDIDAERHGSSGLSAFWWMLHAINDAEILSHKFPHRLIQLLQPYCSTSDSVKDLPTDHFDLRGIVKCELATALERQQGKGWNAKPQVSRDTVDRLRTHLLDYLDTTRGSTTERLRQLIGLLTVTAFLRRHTA
jgi:CRISPR-associated protein Cmr2